MNYLRKLQRAAFAYAFFAGVAVTSACAALLARRWFNALAMVIVGVMLAGVCWLVLDELVDESAKGTL